MVTSELVSGGSSTAGVIKLIEEELARSNTAPEGLPVATGLPPRLLRVLPLLLQGMDIQQIADNLDLSKYTVQEYVQGIYRHFGVCRRAQLQALLAAPSEKIISITTSTKPSFYQARPLQKSKFLSSEE